MGLYGQSLHIISYQEIVITISQQYLHCKYCFAINNRDNPKAIDKIQLLANITDYQARYNPYTASDIYI
jgi:hypothetical protein